jgi:gamma-glutamyl:cysteine ligase YbdK (ATP-grasp superfamily)
MVGSGVMENHTDLRHDVRPHPTLGAVEARVCDGRTRVERTLALAELIQAVVRGRASSVSRAPALELSAADAGQLRPVSAIDGLDGALIDAAHDRGEVMSAIAAGEV